MNYNWFGGASAPAKLLLTIMVMVSFVLIALFFAVLAASLVLHQSPETVLNALADIENPSTMGLQKYFQMVQSVAFFLLPALVLPKLFGYRPLAYLFANNSPGVKPVIIAILLIFMLLPLVNFTEALNRNMQFPAFLADMEQWMKNAEQKASVISENFLKASSVYGLVLNLFMMALLPALGEELIFRGVFQRLFSSWFKNYHWGIIASAALFSAFHMQFYGFVPRMMLGATFGYLLVWSGSMWVPVTAHFVNNALGVTFYYFSAKSNISKLPDTIGTGSFGWLAASFSLVASAMLLYYLYKSSKVDEIQPVTYD